MTQNKTQRKKQMTRLICLVTAGVMVLSVLVAAVLRI